MYTCIYVATFNPAARLNKVIRARVDTWLGLAAIYVEHVLLRAQNQMGHKEYMSKCYLVLVPAMAPRMPSNTRERVPVSSTIIYAQR